MRHKRSPGIIVPFILTLLMLIIPSALSFAARPFERHILIMHAYTPDYPVHVAFNRGLKKRLQRDARFAISYSYEYLDLEHFGNDKDYFPNTARYFQTKYFQRKPDIVVASSGLFRFLIQFGQTIFPGTPILLVNGKLVAKDGAAIPEGFDAKALFEKNIRLILRLKPNTRQIHLVIGNSEDERAVINQIAFVKRRWSRRVKFVYLNKLPYPQMIKAVRHITGDSAILFVRWVNDVSGRSFIPEQTLQTICRAAKVPVYGIAAHFLGGGMLGGYVYNYEIYGRNVGDAALAILNNAKMNGSPETKAPPDEYVFDWRALQRWRIPLGRLPAGSRVEYQKYSIWELYQGYIIGGTLLLMLESLLILGLLVNRRNRKKAYATIEKMSARLREQDKLKDVFLTNTSHEFKTPLHGIMNITQSVLEDTAGRITPRQTQDLTLVITLARRLSALVNDILDFEKIKNNEINLQLKPVDVRSAADIVLDVFRHLAADGAVRLVNRVPGDLPPALADENRLRQVFYNLIGNAVKFTGDGEIAVNATVTGNTLHISVTDTGIGIPPEKQEDVFRSFEQVSASRAKAYGGTGLGLAISRQLVERMGGAIWVAWSETDRGTEITFTLPAGMPGRAAAAPAGTPPQATQAVAVPPETDGKIGKSAEFTILAVDDEPANRRVMSNVFAREGYDILTAADGKEALRLIRENRKIDIVLLDVMMPGMTGYEVCRRLREEHSLFELPVLLITVRSMPEDLTAGFAAGANDYIVKPFEPREMRARVKTLLALKKAVEDTVRAEIAFLQSQIKPHFFYNVLNTIISFCYTDSAKAGKLLAEFSNYLRRSFDIQDATSYTTLENELELVKSYIAIEQARFGDRLTVTYDIDAGLLNRRIPPLIIQPLVENAVRHGLMKLEDGGRIQVTAEKEADGMVIAVADNGVGISPGILEGLLYNEKETGGVGLRNINGRLLKFYGTKLRIDSLEGQGATVTIKIPRVD